MIEFKIYFSSNGRKIGYDYIERLHGFISELLGDNNYGCSNHKYLYSHLCNVNKFTEDGIIPNDNMYIIVRSEDESTFVNLMKNYNEKAKCEAFYGIKLSGFSISEEYDLTRIKYKTLVSSPIIIPNMKGDWLNDAELSMCESYMIENVKRRAAEKGFIVDEELSIKITNQKKHSDFVYRGIINKGRVFDLKITANKETKNFILTNGIGISTGIGFGMIY